MKKKSTAQYIFLAALSLVVINYVISFFNFNIDLTKEKRFTLSQPTRQLLMSLEEPVEVTVLLKGEFPAGFKKLANSTTALLRDFKQHGRANFQFRFLSPAEDLNDSTRVAFIDSLAWLGLQPTNVKAQTKKGEGEENRLVFPGAVIRYKDRVIAVDLLEGQSSLEGVNALNNAEALLEFKFANAIQKIIREEVPAIAYAIGHGQSLDYNMKSLFDALKSDYYVDTVNIRTQPFIPQDFQAVLIIKPVEEFTESDKLKIDQYIMRGGKVMWMIDNLYAELDSLQRAQSDFVAFDRGLNLTDLLFKYGVRINPDLVQDLQSDQVPIVIGTMGGKAQIQPIPFPYFVQLNGAVDHPVSRNLDKILSYFPSSIDTVGAQGIKKTVILHTSVNARRLSTPAMVSLNSLKTEEDLNTFREQNIPVGVLLEGRFNSLFANRISRAAADSLSAMGLPFRSAADTPTAMVVIADGDIAQNQVSRNEGPLPMGMNPYTRYPFANKEFVMNTIEYLVGNTGILETRSKDYTLRLLNKKKIEEEKTGWQLLNILAPVLLITLAGGIFQFVRKQKYQH
ncbi:MAG TPA: gliding motility-associated ABC transporter substrate-binding protein GldG [Parasegetibacter sp.]